MYSVVEASSRDRAGAELATAIARDIDLQWSGR
jgi:hypothetical protein